MNYEEKKIFENLKIIGKWFAGFRYTGWVGIGVYNGEVYHAGHDGTGNQYFFAPFCRKISVSEAKDLLAENTDLSTSEIDELLKDVSD